MKKAGRGDNVKIHYKGSFDDGSVFDSSLDCDPLEFKIGGGQVTPGFEDAVIGMQVGKTKTPRITTDKAYGSHLEEMVVVFQRGISFLKTFSQVSVNYCNSAGMTDKLSKLL